MEGRGEAAPPQYFDLEPPLAVAEVLVINGI